MPRNNHIHFSKFEVTLLHYAFRNLSLDKTSNPHVSLQSCMKLTGAMLGKAGTWNLLRKSGNFGINEDGDTIFLNSTIGFGRQFATYTDVKLKAPCDRDDLHSLRCTCST